MAETGLTITTNDASKTKIIGSAAMDPPTDTSTIETEETCKKGGKQ